MWLFKKKEVKTEAPIVAEPVTTLAQSVKEPVKVKKDSIEHILEYLTIRMEEETNEAVRAELKRVFSFVKSL